MQLCNYEFTNLDNDSMRDGTSYEYDVQLAAIKDYEEALRLHACGAEETREQVPASVRMACLAMLR